MAFVFNRRGNYWSLVALQKQAKIYGVSIKSLYNCKNLLQRQLRRYLRQICSMCLVVIKVFITLHFFTLLTNKILLNEPFAKWLLVKRRHNVHHGLLKPNRICSRGETSELSVREIHRRVHRFVHGARNLWRQGQCLITGGVNDQEYLRKISIV